MLSLDVQIACVRRELALRQRAYPKWVDAKRMKQDEADREIAIMQSVHDTLVRLKTVIDDPRKITLAGSVIAHKAHGGQKYSPTQRLVGWIIPADQFEHAIDDTLAVGEIERGYRLLVSLATAAVAEPKPAKAQETLL